MTHPRLAPAALILALALAAASGARAQEAPAAAPAGVDDLAWIAGSWAGSMVADTVEETWLAPAGGRMVGLFRWLKGEEVFLYELMSLEETGDGVVLKIKHFGPDLVGWEEKADAVAFDLVEVGEGRAVFLERGDDEERTRLVYRRVGERGLTVAFEETRDGEPVVLLFRYERR